MRKQVLKSQKIKGRFDEFMGERVRDMLSNSFKVHPLD
jgi:hypothetical protein